MAAAAHKENPNTHKENPNSFFFKVNFLTTEEILKGMTSVPVIKKGGFKLKSDSGYERVNFILYYHLLYLVRKLNFLFPILAHVPYIHKFGFVAYHCYKTMYAEAFQLKDKTANRTEKKKAFAFKEYVENLIQKGQIDEELLIFIVEFCETHKIQNRCWCDQGCHFNVKGALSTGLICHQVAKFMGVADVEKNFDFHRRLLLGGSNDPVEIAAVLLELHSYMKTPNFNNLTQEYDRKTKVFPATESSKAAESASLALLINDVVAFLKEREISLDEMPFLKEWNGAVITDTIIRFAKNLAYRLDCRTRCEDFRECPWDGSVPSYLI